MPRKLSVSPLESWLSLRYSLPPLLQSAPPQGDVELLQEKLLPPISVPVLEDGEGSATPMRCKNVLEIRRRKMNRHKYKKLQKRTKFLKRKVLESRGRRKQVRSKRLNVTLLFSFSMCELLSDKLGYLCCVQKRFEEDLERIWKRAGLKKAPDGWAAPKIFIKQHGKKRN